MLPCSPYLSHPPESPASAIARLKAEALVLMDHGLIGQAVDRYLSAVRLEILFNL